MSPARKTKKKPAVKKSVRKKPPASKKATKKTAKKKNGTKPKAKAKAKAKKAAAKPAGKKAGAKPAAKKAATKKPAAKKAAKKAPAKKKQAAKARPAKAAAPKQAKGAKKAAAAAPSKRVAPRRKSPPKPPPTPASEILPRRAPISPEAKPAGLGNRWTCYECGSKFYDLGKEEPLCPKCGANQRNAPKVDFRQRAAAAEPTRSRESRAMAPLLEDDEEVVRPASPSGGDELNIGLDSVEDAGEQLIEDQEEAFEEEEG